MTTSSLSPF